MMNHGKTIYGLCEEPFPICRITGEGIRHPLRILKRRLPGLKIHAVPSKTPLHPRKEWIDGMVL